MCVCVCVGGGVLKKGGREGDRRETGNRERDEREVGRGREKEGTRQHPPTTHTN